MSDYGTCPNCEWYDTDVEMVDWLSDRVVQVRLCGKCSTEYVVSFADPVIEEVNTVSEDE